MTWILISNYAQKIKQTYIIYKGFSCNESYKLSSSWFTSSLFLRWNSLVSCGDMTSHLSPCLVAEPLACMPAWHFPGTASYFPISSPETISHYFRKKGNWRLKDLSDSTPQIFSLPRGIFAETHDCISCLSISLSIKLNSWVQDSLLNMVLTLKTVNWILIQISVVNSFFLCMTLNIKAFCKKWSVPAKEGLTVRTGEHGSGHCKFTKEKSDTNYQGTEKQT